MCFLHDNQRPLKNCDLFLHPNIPITGCLDSFYFIFIDYSKSWVEVVPLPILVSIRISTITQAEYILLITPWPRDKLDKPSRILPLSIKYVASLPKCMVILEFDLLLI